MININEFNELNNLNPIFVAEKISRALSDEINFLNILDFPDQRGIYFLYLKDKNNPIYIGSANANGRSIKVRCQQYLQQGSGGESFTGKISSLKNINRKEAIEFVRNNISARFIVLNDISNSIIQQRELLCIWAFRPLFNFIQPKTTITEIKWD